jgi:hypothetical protein
MRRNRKEEKVQGFNYIPSAQTENLEFIRVLWEAFIRTSVFGMQYHIAISARTLYIETRRGHTPKGDIEKITFVPPGTVTDNIELTS